MSEPIAEVHEKPYGEAPYKLGIDAYEALYDLCEVPKRSDGKQVRWVPSDLRALHGWFGIESNTEAAQAEPQASVEQIGHLNEILVQYRVALPFDEAERDWLYGAMDAAWGPGSIRIIRRQEARIVSSGLQRVIYGRDLIRRWWAWRRETDEFQGQGTVDLAREALRELVETTSPNYGLPEPYLALRASGGPDPSVERQVP